MKQQRSFFLNGTPCKEVSASLAFANPTYLYGVGVFTTLLVEQGRLVFWSDHRERLLQGLVSQGGLAGEPINWQQQTNQALKKSMEILGKKDLRLRVSVYPHIDQMDDPWEQIDVVTMASEFSIEDRPKLPGFKLKSFVQDRLRPAGEKLKTNNYSLSLKALAQAKQEGDDDVLFFSSEGELFESSIAGCVLIKDNKIYIPDHRGILPSISVFHFEKCMQSKGFEVVRSTLKKKDVLKADCAVLLSSVRGLIRIDSLDGEKLPLKENLFLDIFKSYREYQMEKGVNLLEKS